MHACLSLSLSLFLCIYIYIHTLESACAPRAHLILLPAAYCPTSLQCMCLPCMLSLVAFHALFLFRCLSFSFLSPFLHFPSLPLSGSTCRYRVRELDKPRTRVTFFTEHKSAIGHGHGSHFYVKGVGTPSAVETQRSMTTQ